jgi:predicted GIY-YIG superfamily endonuclease
MTAYVIYALVDPRDNTTRYVGMTSNLYERFLSHLSCNGDNYRRDAWIQELKAANLMVIMQTLETVTNEAEVGMREAYWIHHFLHLYAPLYNNKIPTPLQYLPKKTRDKRLKGIQNAHLASIEIPDKEEDAIKLLHEQGYNQAEIIERIWGYKKGGNEKWYGYRDMVSQCLAAIAESEG